MRKLKRRETLLESLRGGWDHGEHSGFTVASETVREESSKNWVSVWDVFLVFVLGEGGNYHAETAETKIYFFALSEPLSLSSGDSDPLRSGQIDEV